MACKYFDKCEHHSGWCQSDNMIFTCTYGLNRIIAEDTLTKVEFEKEIKQLKNKNELLENLLQIVTEHFGDYGIE